MTKIEIAQRIWDTALSAITVRVSSSDLNFFSQITCEGIEGEGNNEALCLRAATDMAEIWVNRNHAPLLAEQVTLAAGRQMRCFLRAPLQTVAPLSTGADDVPPAARAEAAAPARPKPATAHTRAAPFSVANAINPENTFENFMIGPENELAHAAALSVSSSPGNCYNPLFIYGNTGLGKTHLLHAIAHAAIQRDPHARILYVSSEAFTNEYIETVKNQDYSAFRSRYREADYLLIDDIQFIAGRDRTQAEFFHTFNTLHTNRKQIVITSDRPAKEIASLEDRLVSRFDWGFTADIQPPCLDTRVAILGKKAEAAGLVLPEDIQNFLAERIYKNVRNLEGAILKLHGYQKLALENGARKGIAVSPLTRERVQELLHNILADEASDRVTPTGIQKIVAEYYRLDPAEMTGKRRTEQVAFARQLAMYLVKQHTSLSLSAIGEAFGGRDHGTVIHAVKTVENRMSEKKSVKTDVNLLAERVLHPRA